MMYVMIIKDGKEYEFWGIRSLDVREGRVSLYIKPTDSIPSEVRIFDDGHVASVFVYDNMQLDYSNTDAEAIAATW